MTQEQFNLFYHYYCGIDSVDVWSDFYDAAKRYAEDNGLSMGKALVYEAGCIFGGTKPLTMGISSGPSRLN